MAETLDQMLAPGERVVYRDPQPRLPWWVPRDPSFLLVLLGFVCAYYLGPAFRPGEDAGLLGFGLLLLIFVVPQGAVLWVAVLGMEGKAAAATVTDRRVLYRGPGEKRERVQLPLAAIGPVSICASGTGYEVDIERPGEAAVRLKRLHRPQDFAAALARAAGQPKPRLIGRLEHLGSLGVLFGGLPCFVLAVFLLRGLLHSAVPPSGLAEVAMQSVSFAAVIYLAFWFGTHLAAVLGLIFLRSRVSAEEARTWFSLAPDDAWSRRLERALLWKGAPYRWFAGRLWGEPMNGPNGGVASHG